MLGFLVVVCGLLIWFAPFVRKHGSRNMVARDKRARWGLLLEMVAIGMVLDSGFWMVYAVSWRLLTGAVLLAMAGTLSWSSTLALGRQLRIDAAIGAEHELIKTGPYRVMRHPIYCSMLLVVAGIGVIAAPWWRVVAALAVCIVGTEVRVRIEEKLLYERFGAEFERYRLSTSAYLPPMR